MYRYLLCFIILAVNCAELKSHCCSTTHGNAIINIIPTEYFKVFKNIIARKLSCIFKLYEMHHVTINAVITWSVFCPSQSRKCTVYIAIETFYHHIIWTAKAIM